MGPGLKGVLRHGRERMHAPDQPICRVSSGRPRTGRLRGRSRPR
jgi:hypothetical protein